MNIEEEIKKAAAVIRDGGIIIYPTDTIPGLGCDARNEAAVARINQLKNRPGHKGLSVIVESAARLNHYVKEVPAIAWDILDTADTPITIVYPEGTKLAAGVQPEDGTVAVRMVQDEFCTGLIRRANCPLVSTSVNKAGQPPAMDFNTIDPEILGGVDYVVNLPSLIRPGSKPSSIIKLGLNGEVEIIRGA